MAIENEKPEFDFSGLEGHNSDSNMFRWDRNHLTNPITTFEQTLFDLRHPSTKLPSLSNPRIGPTREISPDFPLQSSSHDDIREWDSPYYGSDGKVKYYVHIRFNYTKNRYEH